LAVLQREQVRWVLGSTQAGMAQGMMQGVTPIDVTLDQVAAENFDGMIILGGSGAKMYLWFNAEVKRLVLGMHKLRRPLGAVSIAPAAFAYAGILTGRRASVLPAPEIKKLFEKNQVTLATESLTVDGRLVTAGASEDAAGLARAVAGMLPRKSRAKAWAAPVSTAPVRPKPTVALPGRK
jgi:protease I